MSRLVIRAAEGDCWPGTLHCDCGKTELVAWHAKFGCCCSGCRAGYRFEREPRLPGINYLVPGEPHPQLADWLGGGPDHRGAA